MHLRLETDAVHQSRHRIEGLLDDVLDFTHDVRHETPVRSVEGLVVYATEQREHTLDVAMLIRNGTEQGLVPLVGRRFAALDRGNLEYHGLPLAFQPRQHVVDQVAIERLAFDVLPAGVGRTDANSFRRHQQHAVGNTEEAPALAYELRKAGVTARLAVNLLVDFVDQLEFFFHILAVLTGVLQLEIDAEAFADHRHRRREYVG